MNSYLAHEQNGDTICACQNQSSHLKCVRHVIFPPMSDMGITCTCHNLRQTNRPDYTAAQSVTGQPPHQRHARHPDEAHARRISRLRHPPLKAENPPSNADAAQHVYSCFRPSDVAHVCTWFPQNVYIHVLPAPCAQCVALQMT